MVLEQKKRIFYYVSAWWATEWYRCLVPGKELQKRGFEVSIDDSLPELAKSESDVIVFCRNSSAETLTDIVTANEKGILTVFDLDEDVWHVEPTSPAYHFWQEEGQREVLEHCLSFSQVVTTPTPTLARALRRFNRNVHVIPNALPKDGWTVRRANRKNKVVIGWAGGESHFENLATLEGIFAQLLEEFSNLEINMAGLKSFPFLSNGRIKALRTVEMADFPKMLAKFDIAVAPLVDSQYNRARSDLKYLEYAAVGLPVVASKVEPFARSIHHGNDGFLASSPKDWLRFLRRLIEEPELRRTVGKKAKEKALSRKIDKNVQLWEEAFTSSLRKRQLH